VDEFEGSRSGLRLVPKWYGVAEVAGLLGYGLSKTKLLIATWWRDSNPQPLRPERGGSGSSRWFDDRRVSSTSWFVLPRVGLCHRVTAVLLTFC